MAKWSCIAVLAVTCPIVAAPVALAAGDPPKPPASSGAIGVYIEQIPTSKGSVHAGASNNSGQALPPKIAKKVEAQPKEDADRLKAIATSSGYGAPQPAAAATTTSATTTPAVKPNAASKPSSTNPGESPSTAVEPATPRSTGETAAASATAAGDDSNFVPFLGVVAAVALIGLAIAVSRRRVRRPRTR